MPNRWVAWKRLEAELGGRLEISTGLASSHAQLELHAGNVRLTVVGNDVPYAPVDRRGGFTKLMADVVPSAGMRMAVQPPSALSRVLFGLTWGYRRQSVAGESRFRHRFDLLATDDWLATSWLTRPLRDRLVELEHYGVWLNGGTLRVEREGLERDQDRLRGVVSLTVALARRGRDLDQEWSTLTDGIDTWRKPPESSHSARSALGLIALARKRDLSFSQFFADLRREHDGRDYFLSLDRVGGRRKRTRTVLRVKRVSQYQDRFAIVRSSLANEFSLPRGAALCSDVATLDGFLVYGSDCGLLEERLDPRTVDAIESAGDVALTTDGSMILAVLPGIVTDPQRLDAAMVALSGLSIDSRRTTGPYR